MRCERIGNSSLLVQAGVFRADELLVSGELVYVFADPVVKQPRPVPPELRLTLQGFEAGVLRRKAATAGDVHDEQGRTAVLAHRRGRAVDALDRMVVESHRATVVETSRR